MVPLPDRYQDLWESISRLSSLSLRNSSPVVLIIFLSCDYVGYIPQPEDGEEYGEQNEAPHRIEQLCQLMGVEDDHGHQRYCNQDLTHQRDLPCTRAWTSKSKTWFNFLS